MSAAIRLLSFQVRGLDLALDWASIERVLQAAEAARVPAGPEIMLGVINVGGRIFPVLDPSIRLGMPIRQITPDQALILVRSRRLKMALLVDKVHGLIDADSNDFVPHPEISPGLGHVSGILKRQEGLVWIQDLERFLSLHEEKAIEGALDAYQSDISPFGQGGDLDGV